MREPLRVATPSRRPLRLCFCPFTETKPGEGGGGVYRQSVARGNPRCHREGANPVFPLVVLSGVPTFSPGELSVQR